jgi:predicted permease
MPPILSDVGYGLRTLRRNPGFTVIAILTLGLGIAVNTTVFSWINSVLLHPYPGVADTRDLALLETVTPTGEYLAATSWLDYRDYRDNLKLVSGVAVGRFTPVSVGAGGRTARAFAELVSPNYFDLLKVRPVLGRTFLPGEGRDLEGSAPVAVIGYGMWQALFGGDARVLGKTIRLNRHEVTVIGVAPGGFHGTFAGVVFDIWMPITMASAMGSGGTLHYRGCRDETSTIVRLKPGVTIEQARAEAGALGKRLAALYPNTNRSIDVTVTPLWQGHFGVQSMLFQPLRVLMALSLLLLLIVCANVSNLLLARAVRRQREFGLRLALGARRSRIAAQLLIETLLLAAGGVMVGVMLVLWVGQSLLSLMPISDIPMDVGGELNRSTLGFTLLLAVVVTLLSGTAPALLVARSHPNETLKEGGRGGGSGSGSHRLRGLLAVCEMTLVMVALIGAGLFYRSFRYASAIQPGFDRNHISVSQFYLSNAGYSAREQWDFCRSLRRRMEGKPGVIGGGYSDVIPMSMASGFGSTPTDQIDVEGYAPSPNEQMVVHLATVSPGYFNLLGIAMLAGRDFTERDSEEAPIVIVVNQTFADRFFRGRDPIGRTVRTNAGPARVIGLVKNSKYHTPIEAPIPFFYAPFRQRFAPSLNFSVFIKTNGDPMAVTADLRREALALNQDAVFSTGLLSEATARSLFAQRAEAGLLGAVGGICLLLAAVGLYSVMSYAVSQRTQEIGIRMALGAQPGDLLGMVLREGLRLAARGLLAGGSLALAATRVTGGLLTGVSAADPLTFASAAAFLTLVAALASYLPALRAMRVDPVIALRNE